VAVNITIFLTGLIALALHLGTSAGDRAAQGRLDSASRVVSERLSANPVSKQSF
jgi:hypothetical protein